MSSIKEVIVNELHKPARKNYQRRKTKLKGVFDLWQIDLVEVQNFSRENKGFKYLLTVIDCFSKFAWVEPLKTKTGKEVAEAMQRIFVKSKRIPKHIQSDNGKEFYNSYFQKLIRAKGINHYSTFSTTKAAIIERFNRTFKGMMWRAFSLRGQYKYIDILQDLVNKYNNRKHSTTGFKPVDVKSIEVEKRIIDMLSTRLKNVVSPKAKFKVGDFVRISKNKTVFSKGYRINWSPEIFKIFKVQTTTPITYLLEDYKGQKIHGGFYNEELLPVKYKDIYLIEKIIKKRKDKLFVKWLGLPEKSWIKITDIK